MKNVDSLNKIKIHFVNGVALQEFNSVQGMNLV